MPQWKLTLDVPVSFPLELGFRRQMKACDFRTEPKHYDAQNLWREPILGLVMLQPSCINRTFKADFKGIGVIPSLNWNFADGFWREVSRAQGVADFPVDVNNPPETGALLMAPVKPAGQGFPLIEIVIATAKMEILAAAFDQLKWVLDSKFALAEDESFAIHYHGLTDEMMRKENWFALQWDNIGIHFSHTGVMRVFQYDRNDKSLPPILVDEEQICQPSDILNRIGYFYFIPIPNLGLAVYHGLVAHTLGTLFTNSTSTAVRGKLVTWPTSIDGNGDPYLFAASNISIGMNPFHPTMIGFQNIRFPVNTPATFVDSAFALPYQPGNYPSFVGAIGVATRGNLSAFVTDASGDAPWQPGGFKGRVGVTLSTGDPLYTPFMGTYAVVWDPVFMTRNTTPVVIASFSPDGPDRLQRLEWSDNADAHFEGKVDLLLSSPAAVAIALRADATFLLEFSQNHGIDWFPVQGGLAKHWEVEMVYTETWGTHFACKCALMDFWERFNEVHVLWQQPFEGLSIADALNNVLTVSGFSPIDLAKVPPDALTEHIPPPTDGKAWKYAPRAGEHITDVIHMLFLYLRKQNLAYRLRFDWPTQAWVIEPRPRSPLFFWNIVPIAALRNENALVWDYSSLKMKPEPPEGNCFIVEGVATSDKGEASRVRVNALVNYDSLTNVNSPDYLGRMITVKTDMYEVSDPVVLAQMERRIYDAASFRRLKGDMETNHFTWGLAPNTRVKLYQTEGGLVLDAWIKRRTVVVENGPGFEQETMKFELDTIWEQEINAI